MNNIIDEGGDVWIKVGKDMYVLLRDARECDFKTRSEINENWGPVAQVKLPWEW